MITAVVALRNDCPRSFSLPDNKLVATSPTQQLAGAVSSSLIASIEEKRLRTSVDSAAAPQCTVDRSSPASVDVKSPVCDVVVTSHDLPSPIRNVRPTLLDTGAVSSSRVDSSPDDRKPLVSILLNRSPRRKNNLLGSVFAIQ